MSEPSYSVSEEVKVISRYCTKISRVPLPNATETSEQHFHDTIRSTNWTLSGCSRQTFSCTWTACIRSLPRQFAANSVYPDRDRQKVDRLASLYKTVYRHRF